MKGSVRRRSLRDTIAYLPHSVSSGVKWQNVSANYDDFRRMYHFECRRNLVEAHAHHTLDAGAVMFPVQTHSASEYY